MLTGGAGARAMALAFHDVLGLRDALNGVTVAGRTDPWIVANVLAAHGHAHEPSLQARVFTCYEEHLAREIHRDGPRKGVLPGVRELLDALSARSDVYLALLTGNIEGGARIKLEYFDLWRYFRCGAFGDDAPARPALYGAAVSRALACGWSGAAPHPAQAIVIGDTPHDIEVAAVAGARSIAVATGGYDAEALRAAGADVVFEDLRDVSAVIHAIRTRN